MKKYLIIGLFILFVGLTNTAKAQIFLGEAFVGYNLSQIDHDHYGVMGFHRSGVQAGVGVIAPIWKKNNFSLELSLEVLFNQKGALQGKKYKPDGLFLRTQGTRTPQNSGPRRISQAFHRQNTQYC